MKLTTKERKKFRVRNSLKKFSSEGRFRLSVSRSSRNISVQIIDDKNNITILSSSSNDKVIKSLNKKNKTELSQIIWGKTNYKKISYNKKNWFESCEKNIYN